MKDIYDDDRVLLLSGDRITKKFNTLRDPTTYELASIKGAGNQLEKWPTYLLIVFLAAALIVVTISLFVLITAFTIPVLMSHDNRIQREFDKIVASDETSSKKILSLNKTISLRDMKSKNETTEQNGKKSDRNNVYFVKVTNQPWTTKEFCYIESAARENPLLNIHLINFHNKHRKIDDKAKATGSKSKLLDMLLESMKITHERYIEKLLTFQNSNIQSSHIFIEDFFKNTNLAEIVEDLSDQTLQMAVETQLIWNASGIALRPENFCNVKKVSQFFCKNVTTNETKTNENCVKDELAMVDPENDILVAAVPCQTFIGFLLREIEKDQMAKQEYTLKSSLNEFCPSMEQCAEVRIFNETQNCVNIPLNCPIVHQNGFRDY